MADTLDNVNLSTDTWVDLYAATGISVGEPICVENVGASDVLLVVSATEPDETPDGYNVLKRDGDPLCNSKGDAGAWAISKNSDGRVNVSNISSGGFIPRFPALLSDAKGNHISSFRGAVDIHDADVHRAIYNQFVHYETDTTTTTTQALSTGDNQINLTNAADFSVGDEIKIEDGALEPVFFKIMAKNVNQIDIDSPISFAHTAGATVTKIHTNLAQNGLTTNASRDNPVVFNAHVPSGLIVHITNMVISMLDDNSMDDGSFAGEAALNNGLVLRAQSEGVVGTYTNWKDNRNIREDIFTAQYVDKTQSNEYGFAASYNIKKSIGGIVYLDGSQNDKFQVLVQDNLTAITEIRLKMQGHYEGL